MSIYGCVVGLFIGLVVAQKSVASNEEDLDLGYYWRGYGGDIPEDAFPGGNDKRGKPTYIGRTLHGSNCGTDSVIVPGHIYEAEKQMKYEWGYRQRVATNPVQVLCTRHPQQFEWIKTNVSGLLGIDGTHLISGGREKNFTIYIGRAEINEELAIGKAVINNIRPMEGFYTTINNTKVHLSKDSDIFEVLSFNPNLHSAHTKALISNSIRASTVNNLFISLTLLMYLL